MSIEKLIVFMLFCMCQVKSTLQMQVIGLRTTNTYFKIKVNAYNEKSVKITSNITIIGDLEQTGSSEDNILWFYNLVVAEPGYINIIAKGSNDENVASEVIEIEKVAKQLKIQIPEEKILISSPFDMVINVTNQYGSYLTEETKLFINDGIEEYIVSTIDSVFKKSISYKMQGYYTITTISSDGLESSKDLQVLEYLMNIKIDDTSLTSKDIQTIEIIFNISNSNRSKQTKLSLQCISICSGLLFKELLGDSVDSFNFELQNKQKFHFYVLSSGSFKWVASIKDAIIESSKSFQVTNSPYKISSYFSDTSITAYFPIKYTIEVYGDDMKLFQTQVTVIIKSESVKSSQYSEEMIIINGKKTISVIFNDNFEDAYFKIDCTGVNKNNINEGHVEVRPNQISIDKDKDRLPKNIRHPFEFNIVLYDYEKENRALFYGFFFFKVALVSVRENLVESEKFYDKWYNETYIIDFHADFPGTYRLEISCDSCETLYTDEFRISGCCGYGDSAIGCLSMILGFIIIL